MNYYEQQPRPIHFVFHTMSDDPQDNWFFANTIEDGECDQCGSSIGQCWWITSADTDACNWTPYWQIDEDGEHNLCEECYESLTAEVS